MSNKETKALKHLNAAIENLIEYASTTGLCGDGSISDIVAELEKTRYAIYHEHIDWNGIEVKEELKEEEVLKRGFF